MAADFYTEMELSGTKKEVLAMLKIIRKYETENYERYKNHRDCAYIEGVSISGTNDDNDGDVYDLEDMTDKELLEIIDENGCQICVTASGPWGRFGFLDEIDLFRDMAEAAPDAEFDGNISGFNAGGDQDAEFELVDGLLYCRYAFPGDEYLDDEDDEADEDWDDKDDEIEWTAEETYDPVAKKIIESDFDNMED